VGFENQTNKVHIPSGHTSFLTTKSRACQWSGLVKMVCFP